MDSGWTLFLLGSGGFARTLEWEQLGYFFDGEPRQPAHLHRLRVRFGLSVARVPRVDGMVLQPSKQVAPAV